MAYNIAHIYYTILYYIQFFYLKIKQYIESDEYDNIHYHLRNMLLSDNAVQNLKKKSGIFVNDTVFSNKDRENELVDNITHIIEHQNNAFEEHKIKYGDSKRFFMNFGIDTSNAENLSMLERLILDNAKRFMKESDTDFDESIHEIEYWVNNKYYSIHVDCDSLLYQDSNGEELYQGLHNGLIYMDDSYEPTFVSEISHEDRQLNLYQLLDSTFFLSFPKKFRCFAFNGTNFHGAISYNKHKQSDRIVVAYNVWPKKYRPSCFESILSTNETNPITKDEFALIDNNNYFENAVFSPLDYNKFIVGNDTGELHTYIDYVIHQHLRNKVDITSAGVYIFSTPLSRYTLFDEMKSLCHEVKNLCNDKKNIDDVTLWKRYRYKNIVPPDLCGKIIESAEKYVGVGKWPLRHAAYKSCSISLDKLDIFDEFMKNIFATKVLEALFNSYNYNFTWNISDIFINKYDCNYNATGLSPHKDGGHITINIALNDKLEYESGGTKFIDGDELIRLDKGEILIHCAKDMHSGVQITKGTRYIMVIFLHIMHTL